MVSKVTKNKEEKNKIAMQEKLQLINECVKSFYDKLTEEKADYDVVYNVACIILSDVLKKCSDVKESEIIMNALTHKVKNEVMQHFLDKNRAEKLNV